MIAGSFKQRIQANTRYWLSVVEGIQDRAYGPLDPEWPNLLQSLHFAVQHPETRPGAAELWAAAIGYAESRGFLDSWHMQARGIAATIDDLDPGLGCRVANELGFFYRKVRDFPASIRMHTIALDAAQRCGDGLQEALAVLGLGNVAQAENRFSDAEIHVSRALADLESLDPDGLHFASAHNLMGLIQMGRGDHAGAVPHYRLALQIYHQDAHARKAVIVLHNLAMAQRLGGDPAASIETLLSAEHLIRPEELPEAWANLHLALGAGFFDQGDYPKAREMFLRIDQAYLEQHGLHEQLSWTTNNLGNVALKEGDWDLAHDYLVHSSGLFRELGDEVAQANSLGDLATALEHLGRREQALTAVDEALSLLEKHLANDGARKRREAILAQRRAWAG